MEIYKGVSCHYLDHFNRDYMCIIVMVFIQCMCILKHILVYIIKHILVYIILFSNLSNSFVWFSL